MLKNKSIIFHRGLFIFALHQSRARGLCFQSAAHHNNALGTGRDGHELREL
jgi:hypothetical protein